MLLTGMHGKVNGFWPSHVGWQSTPHWPALGPVRMHAAGGVQPPQLPPHPSSPQSLPAQFGVQTHAPALQPWPAPQTFPHAPQLLLSVCVSVQVPLHFTCPLVEH